MTQKSPAVCSRGHRYIKTAVSPVCPFCNPGFYRQNHRCDLPSRLSAPAFRALIGAGITMIADLTHYTEQEIIALHGVGPSSIPTLIDALVAQDLGFKKP